MNDKTSASSSKTVSMPDQMRAAAVCIGMSWAEQEVRQRCFNALQKGADEIEQLRRNETTEALETCKFVKLATTEISRLRATLQKIIDEGDYTAPEGMKRSALAALGNKPHGNETFVIPVSPHMPKRERPAKAPSKSGLRYQQELAHYCGFRWQWLNLPPSEQLETLLEQLADAKDDALRLHHAYVDLKFPEMARPELKANDQLYRLRPLCTCQGSAHESVSSSGYTPNPTCPVHAENGNESMKKFICWLFGHQWRYEKEFDSCGRCHKVMSGRERTL